MKTTMNWLETFIKKRNRLYFPLREQNYFFAPSTFLLSIFFLWESKNKAWWEIWQNSYSLSERLASFGIMEDPIKSPLKHLKTTVLWCTWSFRGASILAPIMPRDVILWDSSTSDRCCFSRHDGKKAQDNCCCYCRYPLAWIYFYDHFRTTRIIWND